MSEQVKDNKNGTYSFIRDGQVLHTGKWGDKYVAPKVSQKPNIIASKPIESNNAINTNPLAITPPKLNLFDFTTLQTKQTPVSPAMSTGKVAPTNTFEKPVIQPTNANQYDEEKIKLFIEHGKTNGKTKEEIKKAYQKGIDQGIFDLQNTQQQETPKKLTVDKIGDRFNTIGENIQQLGEGKLNPISFGLNTVGQIPGAINDIGGDILSAGFSGINKALGGEPSTAIKSTANATWDYLPQSVKDMTINAIKTGGEELTSFSKQHPELIKAAEGLGNIGSMLPVGKILKGTANEGINIIKNTTKNLITNPIKSTGNIIKKTPGLINESGDLVDEGIEKITGKLLGSSDGSKELFKATSPSYNTLSKNKDIQKIVNNAKVADETIIEHGFKPTNTSDRVTAYNETMKKVWNDIDMARGNSGTKFNAGKLSDIIEEEIKKISTGGIINPAIQKDVDALIKQAEYFRNLGNIDIPTLGNQKTLINSIIDWGKTTEYGNTFSNIMKKVTAQITKSEDNILGSIQGGKISEKLKKYGALRSIYDDIVKQDIKALRTKGLPIEETFSRIAGGSELLGGIGQLITNPKQALPTLISGGSKLLFGKVAGKLKDADYLIKTGYEKLLKSKPVIKNNITKKPTLLLPAPSGKPIIGKKPVIITPTKNITQGSKVYSSDITPKSIIRKPTTIAKLTDKRTGIEIEQAKGQQAKRIQLKAQELRSLNDLKTGRGSPDISDNLYRDLKLNKISYDSAEQAIRISEKGEKYTKKNFQEGFDNAIKRLDDEGYTFNKDGFIIKK